MTVFWFFLLFGACTEAEHSATSQPAKKVEVLRTPKHVSSTQEDFEKNSFLCCDNSSFQDILTIYVDLTRAMAQDQETQALKKRTELEQRLSNPEYQSNTSLQELYSLLRDIQPKTLSDLQKNFAPFSIKMVTWIQSFKAKNDAHETDPKKSSPDTRMRVIAAFCPMAPPPGRWLQREDVIQNPFYGSKMLTCGVFE